MCIEGMYAGKYLQYKMRFILSETRNYRRYDKHSAALSEE